jgi:hypothetical protein
VPLLPHDQMIVHHDVQRLPELRDLHRHGDAGGRGAGVAGGVVMHQDDRGGAEFEGAVRPFLRRPR